MPKPVLEPLNFASIARGALVELFESELPKIARNIDDKSTKATKERELVLRIKFKPDSERRAVEITSSADCKLAGVAPHGSRGYLGKDAKGNPYLFAEDPRQDVLFDPPEPEKSDVLDFPKSGS